MSLQDLVIGGAIGAFFGAIFGAVGMYIVQMKGMKAEKVLDLSMKHTQTLKRLVFHKWQIEIDRYPHYIIKPLIQTDGGYKKYKFSELGFKQYENYWSCIKEKHYPDLVERWESLRKEMEGHTNNSCEFFKSLQRQVNEKSGNKVGNFRDGLFITYKLVDDLYNELLKKHGVMAISNIDDLKIIELDVEEKEVYKLKLDEPYFKLNTDATTYAISLDNILKRLIETDIPKILEDKKNNQKVKELVNEGNRLESELGEFHKELQEIQDTVNIVPGKCKACKL